MLAVTLAASLLGSVLTGKLVVVRVGDGVIQTVEGIIRAAEGQAFNAASFFN